MIPKKVEPYNFDPGFEAEVVTLACGNQAFFGRIGHELDPELFKNEQAKIAMRAAHRIYREHGHGPASLTITLQKLRSDMTDGKITLESIRKVGDYFDETIDDGLPPVDDVIAALTPMVALRIRDEATKTAIDAFAKKGDLSKVVALEERAARVGTVDTSIGIVFGGDAFDSMKKLRYLDRLKTGVWELDSELAGGLQKGGLGVFLGASGDGKSMGLAHVAATSVVDGLHVVCATLELPPPIWQARVMANITGIPINTILMADAKIEKLVLDKCAQKNCGRFVCQEFPPNVTTIEDLKEWIARCEDQAGRAIDLFVCDYADKVVAKAKKGDKEASEYQTGKVVYEGLRLYSHERKIFTWTASQATRKKDRKKRLDLNDVADSMHKVRVPDLVVSLNLEEDDDSAAASRIRLFVAKHRTGKSKFEVGPYLTDYELGRLVAFEEE